MIKLWQIILVLCTLSGCSLLGPDYVKPDVKPDANWNSAKSNTNESSNIMSDTAWWQQFNDPTLNEMMTVALKNNNNIQVAIGNILQASAQLEKAHMAWVPTINVAGSAFTGQSFNQNITPTNPLLSNIPMQNNMAFNGSFVGFVPSYSLNIFQIIKNQDVAKLNLKMQQASKNAVRLSVISQVSGGYFSLLALQKQLLLQKQIIADIVESKKYTLIKVANGTANEMNINQIDQSLSEQQAQIPLIQDNIVQTQNALQILMDKNPATIMTHNSFDNIKTDGVIPINIPSSVLQNRPDVIAAEYAVEVSNAKIGLAMSAFFPSITLVSPVGASSFELSNLFKGNVDFWSAQIMASMPLLNMGIYADIKQSKASYYAAYYNYIQTVRTAFSQVDNGLSKHQSSNMVYKYQQNSLNAMNDLYKLSQIQYSHGLISYADTLNFKLNLGTAQLKLNQAKMEQLTGVVNLYQALGGGYNVNNNESAVKFGDNHDV